MALETAKDQITLNYMVEEKKEIITAEGDIIVNDVKPDVLAVINTNGIATIHKKEVGDNKVRIDGNINSYIIYLGDDENESIRSLNNVFDFSEIVNLDKCKSNMNVIVTVTLKNFETKIINSRKVNVKAILEVNIKVYNSETTDMVTEIENDDNIQYLRKSENINVLKGCGTNKAFAKDTITVDASDEIAEIFKVNCQIKNEEQKMSYNKILYKADFEVEILYLTEDNRINSKTAIIPIMGFVDIPNISDNCDCVIENTMQNLAINPNSVEHTIYIEATMEITGFAYENKEYDIIDDLYSITDNLNVEKDSINVIIKNKNISSEYTINEEINIPELKGKIYGTNISTNIKNVEVKNKQIAYSGEVTVDLFFEGNKPMEIKELIYPFETTVNAEDITEQDVVNTKVFIKQENIINKSNGDVTIFVVLGINSNVEANRKVNIIKTIDVDAKKTGDIYSMIIYFVKPGDTLWKIAKKFNSTVQEIQDVNNIENANKIYVGQQLYIPKYVPLKIVV